jgi:hypothetical protein
MTATSKCMLRVLLNYNLAKFLNCFLTLENNNKKEYKIFLSMNLKTEKKYINEKTCFFNQRTCHWFYKYHANHNR